MHRMALPCAPLLSLVVLAGILHRTSGQDGPPPTVVVPWGRDPATLTEEEAAVLAFAQAAG